QIVIFNQAAEKMFMFPASEAIGQPLDRFLPERFRRRHLDHIANFGRGQVNSRFMGLSRTIYGLRSTGEEFVVEASISQCHTPDRKLYTVILRDMTERTLLEQRTRRYNEQLETRVRERTAQLEAANRDLEAFSYSVAHDLRAPLRAVIGFSQILLAEHSDRLDEIGGRLLHTISTSATQCGQLISDLLALYQLSRKDLERKTVDLEDLAHSVVTELQQAGAGRDVRVAIQPLPPAFGDGSMLRQTLINLIENAFKFTRNRPHPEVEIGFRRQDQETVYFVRDNGVGFEMKYYDKLFGIFQRLHATEDFEGTGVGLAIVRRVIDRHDGRVWAESREGAGATFYFTLPDERS
ncbi:MAG TPA: ATP-binding protein, partial [Blastocatellia bacterium]|nr:ATP-binding protein [Blastocatellia bacterium]